MEPLQLQVKRTWLAFIDAMCRQFGENNNFLQVKCACFVAPLPAPGRPAADACPARQ